MNYVTPYTLGISGMLLLIGEAVDAFRESTSGEPAVILAAVLFTGVLVSFHKPWINFRIIPCPRRPSPGIFIK